MSDLNEELLQQLDGSTIVLTSSDQNEMDVGVEDAETQELVEEIIGEDDDQQHLIDTNVSSMHDLITLHAVDSQGNIIGDNDQVEIPMDQSMDQMMDAENIVEEVITSGQDDQFLEQGLPQQFLSVQEAVFNPNTGTLQPVSSLVTSCTTTTPKVSSPKRQPMRQQHTKVKYIIAQPQEHGQQQLILDAAQLQGLINSGASVIKSGGQNLVISSGNQNIKKQVRSPAKILPAPIPVGDQQQTTTTQKFLLKQGTVLTPISSPLQGGKFVQVGGGNQIRYVQVVQNKNIAPSNKIPIAPAKPKPVAPKPLPGQTIILPSSDLNLQHQGLSNFVVVPNFMVKSEGGNQPIPIRPATNLSAEPTESAVLSNLGQQQQQGNYESFRSLLEPNGMRPRKPCNCTKSQCLKLYCDCFANGEFCHLCNCTNCFNNLTHEEDRQKAIKLVLERNPGAFRPKIGKSSQSGEAHERRHNKGCNCRRSGCLKNYCECYEAKIFCSGICKCTGCKNCIENIPTGLPNGMGVEQHFAGAGTSHRQTLKDLAEAAEVRVQQQNQVKNKMRAQMQEVSPQNNLGIMVPPLVFRYPQGSISYEVVTSTVELLLAKAEAAEKQKLSEGEIEKVILEEFGDCLAAVMELGSTME
ncbi:unnamed protein product [Allacma fusca]|uniref:CRC domain-containing protein n=1 Tax=Allacma fusca TaxID=39272 RepID=A0A8J2LA17_9HEXA|nr:unnamed protein product [Allacma fusca]